jgi:hypothetical protein
MKQNSEEMVSVLVPSTGPLSDVFWFSYKHLRSTMIVSKLGKSLRSDTASFLILLN